MLTAALLTAAAPSPVVAPPRAPAPTQQARALAAAAETQVGVTTSYDPAYVKLKYPGGDVEPDRGVCTDVVVRAFRALGVDLQVALHEDMQAHFDVYPRRWGLSRPDANIDHRRVQNLETWFTRRGKRLPVTKAPGDYLVGDVVTMDVDGRAHIAIIASTRSADGERPTIVHNIGAGTQVEDRLFEFPLTGHYRPL